jgi:hypothetical protein
MPTFIDLPQLRHWFWRQKTNKFYLLIIIIINISN